MKTSRRLLNPAMKMADFLDTHDSVPGIFNRMGLSYGFGEASVEEVCRKAGVDTEAFLLICRTYVQDGYRPGAEEIRRTPMKDVLGYLRLSHAYYLNTILPSLADALQKMSRPCDERSRDILHKFFREYRDQLARHFAYEEEKVFPYVEAYLSGASDGHFTAGEFSDIHESVEEGIADLKSLVVKYMPPECDPRQQQIAVLYLSSLEKDIRKHILLEDTLLAPMLAPKERTVLESRLDAAAGMENPLSQREKEILVCVARGMLNKEIADRFHISIYTVFTHRKNIARKTGIKTVAGLTVYALLNHLIDMNTVE